MFHQEVIGVQSSQSWRMSRKEPKRFKLNGQQEGIPDSHEAFEKRKRRKTTKPPWSACVVRKVES